MYLTSYVTAAVLACSVAVSALPTNLARGDNIATAGVEARAASLLSRRDNAYLLSRDELEPALLDSLYVRSLDDDDTADITIAARDASPGFIRNTVLRTGITSFRKSDKTLPGENQPGAFSSKRPGAFSSNMPQLDNAKKQATQTESGYKIDQPDSSGQSTRSSWTSTLRNKLSFGSKSTASNAGSVSTNGS